VELCASVVKQSYERIHHRGTEIAQRITEKSKTPDAESELDIWRLFSDF
jgi:hypothetical protein